MESDEQSPQEQVGQAIADLKKLFPSKSACERADLVLGNPYLLVAVQNAYTNGTGTK
jgi:hypothetical protein